MEIKERIKALEKKIKDNPDVPQELIDQLKELKEDLEINDDTDDPDATSDKLNKEIESLKKELSDLKSKNEKDYTDDLLDRYGVAKDAKAGTVCKAGLSSRR